MALTDAQCRSPRRPSRTGRRAFTLVYVTLIMSVVMGLLMLAVDWGRVQVARTELMNATTSAARAALIDMPGGKTVAVNSAITYAGLNSVDGTTAQLTNADVTLGTWNVSAKTFTANTASPNAVRVSGVRTTARGTAIPMSFGTALGVNSRDVTYTSIARNADDVQVDISAFFNNRGSAPDYVTYASNTGIGRNGYAYSTNSINGTLLRGNSTYVISSATNNCVYANGQTIPLPAGDYKSVVLIVAQAYGPATSNLRLNNIDGTQTTYSQTYSDWCNPTYTILNQNICGTYPYRNLYNGNRNNQVQYLISYEFPIVSSSGVASITLPVQNNLNIFAVGLTPAAAITVK